MMAGSVLTMLPVLALFLALQRHYIAGLLRGASRDEGDAAPCDGRVVARLRFDAGPRKGARRFPSLSRGARGVRGREGVDPGDSGPGGRALCLDFDFGSVSGYAIARRKRSLDYPANFELSFYLRGDAKPNELQVKLVDASGENVWWNQRPDFAFPREWQAIASPAAGRVRVGAGDGPCAHPIGIVRLAIARGQGGGAGTVCIAHLTLRETAPRAILRAERGRGVGERSRRGQGRDLRRPRERARHRRR